MSNNRHRYVLRSPWQKLELDRDPMGWDESETEVRRSEKSYGIFLTISNNLRFTGKAMDFLEDCYQIDGVNAEVKLTKFTKHPITDEWELAFSGYLDFTTRKIEENKFIIDFIEGGMREALTSQITEPFELIRDKDIKDRPISPLVTDRLALPGREIFQLSRLESNTNGFVIDSGSWQSQGDYRPAHRAAPMDIVAHADTENISTVVEAFGDRGNHVMKPETTTFFNLASRDLGRTRITINLSFRIAKVYTDESIDNKFKVFFRRFRDESEDGGDQYTIVEDDIIVAEVDPRDFVGHSFAPAQLSLVFEGENSIKKGDSFGLYFFTNGIYGESGISGNSGQMEVTIDNYSGSIVVETDSYFQTTTSPFMRAYEVGERLTEILTGKKAFKSTLLDTGTWQHLGMTCGFWLRNMPSVYIDEETKEVEYRTMSISFEDFYKSIHALEPVGYGIETNGKSQKIVFEKLRYFFQPHVTIKLGQVSKIKRETATDFIFSSITTGYMKGGNYERPLGLDEYNIKSNYITPITKVNSKYETLGTSRADSYAVEQARRKQYADYPEEDSLYDQDNFLIDAKLLLRSNQNSTFEVRTWQDDFAEAPKGIYSPDTAFNLRLTPARNRNRHAYWFNAATVKYPDKKIIRTTTEGNVKLESQLIGGDVVREHEDILIKTLDKPIFEPEYVTFELPFTQKGMDQIVGKTKINGEFINNFYGQVEFVNENGQKERAYLMNAKIKDKITVKAIKAYGR